MRTRWLDIMRQAGDDHIGQTLERLATLAAAAHRHEAALAEYDTIQRKVPYRLEGPDRMAVVENLRSVSSRTADPAVSADAPQGHGCWAGEGGAESAHTEVSR